MDIDNFIRGAVLVALLLAFLGMVIWAWSKKRHEDFEFMGQLPLDDDDAQLLKDKKESPDVK